METTEGVVTDKSGAFSIERPEIVNPRLIVSYIGYNTDTIVYTGAGFNSEIVLQNSLQIDEVRITKRRGTIVNSSLSVLPTQVITEAGLQKLACCNIGESFESNATVDVGFTDAVTGAKKIRMLGLDGMYSQFLFENIPFLRGMESGFGLNHIPGPFMESIQVSKGTSSVLNGYESTTGQINVEYKKPANSDIFFMNLFANTEGRYESNFTSAISLGDRLKTMFFLHGSLNNSELDHNSDGFYDMPLSRQVNFLNRWEYIIGSSVHAQLGLEVVDEERIGGQIGFRSKDDNPDGLYGSEVSMQKYRLFGKLGYARNEKPWESVGWINSYTWYNQESVYGLRIFDGNQQSYYSNLIWQTIIRNTNHKISNGISFQYDRHSGYFIDSAYGWEEYVPGIFSQYTFSVPEKLVLMAGMRVDRNSKYGMLYTPRLHMKYDFMHHYILRTTLGKAYRSPVVFSESSSFLASSRNFVLDSDFRIERAWNTGVSFSRDFHFESQREATLSLDYYYTTFQDQVVVDLDADVSEVRLYNLDGPSYSHSLQAELSGEFLTGLEMTLAWKWNDVRVSQEGGLTEKAFTARNRGLFTTTYSSPFEKWKIDLTVQHNGRTRIPSTQPNPEEFRLSEWSPAYYIVHSQLTRKFKRFDVYTGVENLTGFRQKHAIIDPVNPFGEYFDASLIWGPITGRMFYVGMRMGIK
jgi:outer membrane receptor for ferrienterochelin and colicins